MGMGMKMTQKRFNQSYKRKERVWDAVVTTIVIICISISVHLFLIYTDTSFPEDPVWFVFNIFFFVIIIGVGSGLVIIKPLDYIIRNSILKDYFITDCGGVITITND